MDSETVLIPRLSGKPPKKTSKPLAKVDFENLAKIDFKTMTKDVRRKDDVAFNVKHKIAVRPLIDVSVAVLPCKKCTPMDVEKWRADKELKNAELAKDLQDAPGTIYEVGEATLGGQKLIYQYQLGWNLGRNDTGITGSYTHSYMLFHNDGINEIRVRVNYADDPPASVKTLTELAPRPLLEEIAAAVVDTYTQAWAP